jgi:hypothetical protein
MLKVRQTTHGTFLNWEVRDGDVEIGRIWMRFGDCVAYSSPGDTVLWRTVMREDDGSAPCATVPSKKRRKFYLRWAIWRVWVNQQSQLPDPPLVEFELEKEGETIDG